MTCSIAVPSWQSSSAALSWSRGPAEERTASEQFLSAPHSRCAATQLGGRAWPSTIAAARGASLRASRHIASLGVEWSHSRNMCTSPLGQVPGQASATSKAACRASASSHIRSRSSSASPRGRCAAAASAAPGAAGAEPLQRGLPRQRSIASRHAPGAPAAPCGGVRPRSLGASCASSARAPSQRSASGRGSSAAYAVLRSSAPSIAPPPPSTTASGPGPCGWHSATRRSDSSSASRSSQSSSALSRPRAGTAPPPCAREAFRSAALQRGLAAHARRARAQSRDGTGRSTTDRTSTSSRILPQSSPCGRSAAASRDSRISFCGSRPGHSADTPSRRSIARRSWHVPRTSESMRSVAGLSFASLAATGPQRESSEHWPSAATHLTGRSRTEEAARASVQGPRRGTARRCGRLSEAVSLESLSWHLATTRDARRVPVSLPQSLDASAAGFADCPPRMAPTGALHSASPPQSCKAS
mmetsp:Transcript_62462/g.193453  ORF Transcript_62462/g.193453 Transcript_62462/m.193453 type:complete len:473 (-) Transcript_62462:225-1643(-)